MTEVTISRAGAPHLVRLGNYLVDNKLLFHMFDTLTVSDTETVLYSAAVTQFLSSTGVQLEIISTDNTNDKAGGTGLLTAKVWYINTDNEFCYEIMTLTGTTGSGTTATDIKAVLPFYMQTVGSGKDPAGAITIENTANDTDYVAMAAGDESLFLGNLYCPKGYIGYYQLHISYETATAATEAIQVKQYISDGATNEVLQTVKCVVLDPAIDEAAHGAHLLMEGILYEDKINIFKSLRLGGNNQTVNFSMEFGFRRL